MSNYDYLYKSNIGIIVVRKKSNSAKCTFMSDYIRLRVFPEKSKKIIKQYILQKFTAEITQLTSATDIAKPYILIDKNNPSNVINHRLQISNIGNNYLLFTFIHNDIFTDSHVRGLRAEFLESANINLRTFLTGIIGMTNLLGDSCKDREQQEYIEAIKMCSNNIIGIINDLIDFSKLESNTLSLNMSTFDIKQAVETCIKQTDIPIEILWNNIPRFVIADKYRFIQVFNTFLTAFLPNIDGHMKDRVSTLGKIDVSMGAPDKYRISVDRYTLDPDTFNTFYNCINNFTNTHDLSISAVEIETLKKKSKMETYGIEFNMYVAGRIYSLPSIDLTDNHSDIRLVNTMTKPSDIIQLDRFITTNIINNKNELLLAQQICKNMGGDIFITTARHFCLRLCITEWDTIDQDLKEKYEGKFTGKTGLIIESDRTRQLELANTLVHIGIEVVFAIDYNEAIFYLQNHSDFSIIFCNIHLPHLEELAVLLKYIDLDKFVAILNKSGNGLKDISLPSVLTTRKSFKFDTGKTTDTKYKHYIVYPYKARDIYGKCTDVLNNTLNRSPQGTGKPVMLDICIWDSTVKNTTELESICKTYAQCTITIVRTHDELQTLIRRRVFHILFMNLHSSHAITILKYINVNIRNKPHIIGIYSNNGTPTQLAKYYKLGMDAYIDIPFNNTQIEYLLQIISRTIST